MMTHGREYAIKRKLMSRTISVKRNKPETLTILRRLMVCLGVSTKSALAKRLEIVPSAVTDAIRKSKIPDVWLYRVAYETGAKLEWLRTGEGTQNMKEVMVAESQAVYAASLDTLDEEIRTAVKRLITAMSSGDELIRSHLIGQLRLVEEALAARHRPSLAKEESDRLELK